MDCKIPERWLDYSSTGQQIGQTPFIAFKTPLCDKFLKNIPKEQHFGPDNLIKMLPDLCLIIDLTYTTKYYNADEFRKTNIKYEKIMCPGHIIPSEELLTKFFTIVDDFTRKNCRPGAVKLIGVHCTHGVNRTGFFICSYMIRRMGYNFESAVAEFNSARGHNIERLNYIKELQQCGLPTLPISCNYNRRIASRRNLRDQKICNNNYDKRSRSNGNQQRYNYRNNIDRKFSRNNDKYSVYHSKFSRNYENNLRTISSAKSINYRQIPSDQLYSSRNTIQKQKQYLTVTHYSPCNGLPCTSKQYLTSTHYPHYEGPPYTSITNNHSQF